MYLSIAIHALKNVQIIRVIRQKACFVHDQGLVMLLSEGRNSDVRFSSLVAVHRATKK